MPRELFGTSHGATVWLCTDGCGLTCATITWTLHIFAWSAVTKLVGLAHSRLPHPTALHVVCVVSRFALAVNRYETRLFTHRHSSSPSVTPPRPSIPTHPFLIRSFGPGWSSVRWRTSTSSFTPS